MSQQDVDELKAMYNAGTPYAQMCAALGGICARHLRRLLAAAGITGRAAGRPRKHPPGKRVGYEFAGVL